MNAFAKLRIAGVDHLDAWRCFEHAPRAQRLLGRMLDGRFPCDSDGAGDRHTALPVSYDPTRTMSQVRVLTGQVGQTLGHGLGDCDKWEASSIIGAWSVWGI